MMATSFLASTAKNASITLGCLPFLLALIVNSTHDLCSHSNFYYYMQCAAHPSHRLESLGGKREGANSSAGVATGSR